MVVTDRLRYMQMFVGYLMLGGSLNEGYLNKSIIILWGLYWGGPPS